MGEETLTSFATPEVEVPRRIEERVDREKLERDGYSWVSLPAAAWAWPPSGPSRPVRDVLKRPSWVQALARSPALQNLAEAVLGPSARPVRANLFTKGEGANWFVPWHQDRVVCVRARAPVDGFSAWTIKGGLHHAHAPMAVLARMVALRLHLDDCPLNAGPLEVVPGSHRQLHAPSDLAFQAFTMGTMVLPAQAGQVLVMRPLLVHRSKSARSPTGRRILHVEYAASPLPAPLAWRYGGLE